MKVEAGKRYVRRDGSVTDPLVFDEETPFLIDIETGFYYDALDDFVGNMIMPYSKIEHDCDLIAEYVKLEVVEENP